MERNVQDAGVSIKGLLRTVAMVNILRGKKPDDKHRHIGLWRRLFSFLVPSLPTPPSLSFSVFSSAFSLPLSADFYTALYFLNFQANYPLMLSFFFLNWLLKIRKPQRACPGDSRWAVSEKAQSFGPIRYLYIGTLYSLLRWWNPASCFIEEFYDLLTANSS